MRINCWFFRPKNDRGHPTQVTGNKLWRRSTEKQFWLYQLDGAGNAIRVLDEFLGGFKASACLYAGFAPQGNHFALVCNFNLYIVDPTGMFFIL